MIECGYCSRVVERGYCDGLPKWLFRNVKRPAVNDIYSLWFAFRCEGGLWARKMLELMYAGEKLQENNGDTKKRL